jgi:hypothetical protein
MGIAAGSGDVAGKVERNSASIGIIIILVLNIIRAC